MLTQVGTGSVKDRLTQVRMRGERWFSRCWVIREWRA